MIKKIDKESSVYKRFILRCSEFCKKANVTTKQAIYAWMVMSMREEYKGKNVNDFEIRDICKEFTNDICANLKIK